MITFLRGNDAPVMQVRCDDGSQQQKELMSKDILSLNFSIPVFKNLAIGDYVRLFGQKYTLNQLNPVKKQSGKQFVYNISLEGEMYDLGKVEYLFLGDDNTLTETDFSITGDLQKHAELIIMNMNRIYPGVWSLGTVADSDTRTVSYSQDNCLSALGKFVQEFELEYFFQGYILHIYKRSENSGITLQYGRGNGLYSIERTNADSTNVITRLYAFGGSTNLPANYRGGATKLLLPNVPYIEQNVDIYGVIEGVKVFDTVYPKRTGTVTAVDADDYQSFTDSTLDFDVNDSAILIPGTTVKIVFNTGQLAGYKFDVNVYNTSTKTFRINVNKDEKAIAVPSDLLRPAIGDEYVIEDIFMPASYVTGAEADLLSQATDYMTEYGPPRMNYNVDIDRLYVRNNNLSFEMGTNVHVTDPDIGIDRQIRITAVTRDVNYIYQYNIKLSDITTVQILTRVIAQQRKTTAVLNLNKLTDPARARRNWRDTQELQGMVFDPDGHYFSEKIKPLSIETTMLSVGARSQQFALNGVLFRPNLNADASKFSSSAGQLVNFTIADLPVTWNIAAATYNVLTSGVAYYIYAKCVKTGDTGEILLSTEQITFDSDPVYYHFLIGVLHSDIDGVRGISVTYGQTTINGRTINTGVIRSIDGLTWFDLDEGVISGKITFTAGSSGYDNLTDKPDLSVYANQDDLNAAQDAANAAQAAADSAQSTADSANAAAASAQAAADAAQSTADTANTAAASAQSAADTANNKLADIANDDLVTVSEKPGVLKEWQAIEAEKPIIDAQADTYSISHTVYDSAYTDLSDYITPMFDDMAVDTSINGEVFRSFFMGYYSERVTLLKAVSDAAKAIADSAQGAADDAQSSADTAQSAADAAHTAANTAQDAADAAQAAADAAQATANTANANAANAQATADAAHDITSYLFTTIAGNVVATGTLLVGDATNNNAGITGVTDNGDESVRFWAGAAYADKDTAPFRVNNSGAVVMANADITGKITASEGKIGTWNITAYGLESSTTDDARVKLTKSLSGGGTIVSAIGSNINEDGFVGVFTIDREGTDRNFALLVRAYGSTVQNMAINSSGDCRFVSSDENPLNFIVANLPHTNTMAGYGTVVARNDDGKLFIF